MMSAAYNEIVHLFLTIESIGVLSCIYMLAYGFDSS